MTETSLLIPVEVDLVDNAESASIGLTVLFRRLGPLIPADPKILAAVWPDRVPPPLEELADGVERLIAAGHLRIVHLGGEAHLTPLSRYETAPHRRSEMKPLPTAPSLAIGSAATPLSVPASASVDDTIQQLELAIDAERERAVLYRVLVVMEVIGLLLFARMLWL